MIPVSETYAEAIKAPYRTDRITGTITFSDGTVIAISDDIIINNSVMLTEQVVSGNTMEIGTFFTNQLGITVYDEDFQSHNYANAKIVPYYGLKLPDDTWEDIPLGEFKVDNSYTKRKGPKHILTAFDCSVEFDRDISAHTATATVQEHIVSACKEVGVEISESLDFFAFPNVDEVVDISSKSIQTYRDMVEWCAALLGASARINRYGKFDLVQLKEKTHEQGGYAADVVISGNERFGTEFFDLRALVKYVSTTFDGQVYVHTTNNVLNDDVGRNAIVFVPENPLLKGKDNARDVFINSLSAFKIALRRVEFSFIGNPAMECFDTVGANSGQIDVDKNIVFFPTKLVWKYRGKHSVSCAFAELTDEATFSQTAKISTLAAGDTSLPAPVKVRSQTDKRIDGLQGGSSGGVGKFTNDAKNSEIFNDYENNFAGGEYSHTAGRNNKNVARISSICGGADNTTSGNSQLVVIGGGSGNSVQGYTSGILAGLNNSIAGNYSAIVSGENNELIGDHSFIGSGKNIKIHGLSNVFANGIGLVADRNDQILFGKYNAPTGGKGVFVIGNGTSDSNRSNLYVIYEDGSTS